MKYGDLSSVLLAQKSSVEKKGFWELDYHLRALKEWKERKGWTY